SLGRAEPGLLPNAQVALVRTFADQAVIAIENVRLFNELGARNAALTTALDRQTATGEILRVISSSPSDAQPVFESIARSAARLCHAPISGVLRFDGELLHIVADHNFSPEASADYRQAFPMRPSSENVTGRAVLERRMIHLADVEQHAELAISRGF